MWLIPSNVIWKRCWPRFRSKLADELLAELGKLMIVCWENLHHVRELQKQAHNKEVKSRSYASDKKVWLNSKYIKTKQKRKLEAKFFELFQVLHAIKKQAYKLKLSRKWKIHDVFHVLLLEQDITKKGRVDKEVRQMEFNAGDNNSGKYKIEPIRDNAVHAKNSKSGYLPGLYYLVSWKGYPEEENT